MAESVKRQIGYRTGHSSEILEGDLIIWGGHQDGLPLHHDSKKKRSITTRLDILNLPTMEWNNVSTTGEPPAGVIDYRTAIIGEEMYVFGGKCDHFGNCVHNDLHKLNTNNRAWRSIPCTNRPMKKSSCGFISYFYQGSDYLLALGGEGGIKPPTEPQPHSLYTTDSFGRYWTNEVHIMNITTSPGTWISPTVTGDRPPPILDFTLNQLPNDRSKAVLFGGLIVPETNMNATDDLFDEFSVPETNRQCSTDIYILSLTNDTVEFTNFSPQPCSLWPKPRDRHSSTVISNGTEDYLLVIGGKNNKNRTLAECWALNITAKTWSQIDLPESVSKRCSHSVSIITLKPNTHWIIVNGGEITMGNCSGLISNNVTQITELVNISGVWVVGGVWNSPSTQRKELIKRMKKIRPAEKLQANNERLIRVESMTRELQQTRQLNTSQQSELADKHTVKRQLTDDIQRLQADITENDRSNQQLILQIEPLQAINTEKDHANQQLIQQLQTNIIEKDTVIQQLTDNNRQLTDTNQQLQANITEKDGVIERHENTIAQQQREITHHHDDPPWLIEQEEVVMTQEVLGRGGWGEVKVGVFRGTRVAIKTLHDLILSDYYLQLFSREMNIASRVRHPNLLQFIGATRVGNLMIVTELMPTSLRKELEKSPMTRPQILSVSIDVASGLNYLHCWRPQSILHRDVSSANVLLEPSGNDRWKAKLSDYGSVNLIENIQTANPGSPIYSAPEANNPAHHSPAMDVYSFGVLLLEMTTGQFPPSVEHEREGLIQDVRWATVKTLISHCTSSVPSSRPTTINALQQLRNIEID